MASRQETSHWKDYTSVIYRGKCVHVGNSTDPKGNKIVNPKLGRNSRLAAVRQADSQQQAGRQYDAPESTRVCVSLKQKPKVSPHLCVNLPFPASCLPPLDRWMAEKEWDEHIKWLLLQWVVHSTVLSVSGGIKCQVMVAYQFCKDFSPVYPPPRVLDAQDSSGGHLKGFQHMRSSSSPSWSVVFQAVQKLQLNRILNETRLLSREIVRL